MTWTDEQLEAHLAGELPSQEAAALKADLKSDPELRARLDEAKAVAQMLRASAPEVPSARMWKAIRSRIASPVPAPRPWFSALVELFTARPMVGWSVAAVAASLFLVVGIQVAQKNPTPVPPDGAASQAAPAPAAEREAPQAAKASAPASKRDVAAPGLASAEKKSVAAKEEAAPAPAALAAAPAAEAEPARRREPTEVERALNEQQLDGLIAEMLRRQRSSGASALSARPTLGAETVGYGARAAAPRAMAAYDAEPASAEAVDSGALAASQGGVDANGFWNFRPAAVALNRRDWRAAESELKAAKSRAPEASERAFAASALNLLGQPGQPLDGRVAPMEDEESLVVQSAGRWQAFVDSRVARYGNGVITRLPGLRAEGSELLLDWSFDRASFSPGTRFTRLSGDSPASVISLQGAPVDENEFMAPRGADYLLRAKELRLK